MEWIVRKLFIQSQVKLLIPIQMLHLRLKPIHFVHPYSNQLRQLMMRYFQYHLDILTLPLRGYTFYEWEGGGFQSAPLRNQWWSGLKPHVAIDILLRCKFRDHMQKFGPLSRKLTEISRLWNLVKLRFHVTLVYKNYHNVLKGVDKISPNLNFSHQYLLEVLNRGLKGAIYNFLSVKILKGWLIYFDFQKNQWTRLRSKLFSLERF